MGFDLEKRLANELNRLQDEASHDVPVPQKVERLKQLAAEIRDRLLGIQQESQQTVGKRTASMDEVVASAVEKFDAITERARGFQVGVPWAHQQRVSFDDFRASALREVIELVSSSRLRTATLASAEPAIRTRAAGPQRRTKAAAAETPSGQAMWRVAERRAATLYRHAMDAGEVAGEDPIVDEALARCGSGQPLPLAVRKQMEAELGISLARVRVHTDSVAAEAARAVRAEAFTVGEDIFFADGAFAPDSREGKKLIAHELTHVVQAYQGRMASPVAGIHVSQPGEELEREADAMAERIDDSFGRMQQPVSRRAKRDDDTMSPPAIARPTATAAPSAERDAMPRARGSQPSVAVPAPTASASPSASGGAMLMRRASHGAQENKKPENKEARDPEKRRGIKPILQLSRDAMKEQSVRDAKKGAPPPRDGAAKIAADVKAASAGALNQLHETKKRVKDAGVGKHAKHAHKEHKRKHKDHKKHAKKLKKHAHKHAEKHGKKKHKHKQHQKPGHLKGDTGPIQFKKIGSWDKFLPQELPDQDKKEKKRILKLVKAQINGERHDSAVLLNQLRKANIKAAGEVRAMLPGLTGSIRAGQSAALGKVSAAESTQAAAVQAATAAQQALVRSTSATMIGQVNSAASKALNTIRTAKQDAMTKLSSAKTAALSDIDSAESLQVTLINLQFEICHMQLVAVGAAKASEAISFAASFPWSYDGDKLEAAQNAAKDVGAAYAEAMPGEAEKAWGQISGEKAKTITDIRKMATDQRKQVNDAFTQCRDTVNQSAQAATTSANQIKSSSVSQIQSTASTTVAQLGTAGAQAVAGIHQQAAGARAGIQKAGDGAIAAVTKAVNTASQNLIKQAKGITQGAKKVETPNVAQTRETVQKGMQGIAQAKQGIAQGMQKQVSGAVSGMNGQAQGAAQGMTQAAAGAKASAQQMGAGAVQGMTQAATGAKTSLTTLGEGFQKQCDEIGSKGKESMEGVVKGLREAYAKASQSLGEGLSKTVEDVRTSFGDSVTTQEAKDIQTNGDKAADAVPDHWWQKALAFVVSVVVAIVVVVVVTALIVTTGPVGAILVGAAAGALGSVLGQMASNLVLGQGLFDGITWQSVAMGAVGGAIGAGFTQAISAGVGRFGSTALQGMLREGGGVAGFALRTGVGVAGDTVSDAATQLLFTGGYHFDVANFVTSIATNAASATHTYDSAQTRFQEGIRARTGHIELGTVGGGKINLSPSYHGRGESVSTGANTGTKVQDVHSGGEAGHNPADTSHTAASHDHGTPARPHTDTSTTPRGDQTTAPRGDQTTRPRGDQTSTRPGDQTTRPHGDQTTRPHGDQTTTPHGDQTTTPHGDQTTTPHGDQTTTRPHGDQTTTHPHGDQTTTPHGDQTTTPHGDQTTTPHGDQTTHPHGDQTSTHPHGGDAHAKPGEHKTTKPHGDDHHVDTKKGGAHDEGHAHGDEAGSTPHADDGAHDGPESAAADALSELGYPNPTREKANAAADAIESGRRPPADTVRETEANQRGLRELERINKDPNLTPESKQRIREEVAAKMRADEPSGDLSRDVQQAKAHEQARIDAAKAAKAKADAEAKAKGGEGEGDGTAAKDPTPGDGTTPKDGGPAEKRQKPPEVGKPNENGDTAHHEGGLNDPKVTELVETRMRALKSKWADMTLPERYQNLRDIVHATMDELGIPRPAVGHDTLEGGTQGYFHWDGWKLVMHSDHMMNPHMDFDAMTNTLRHEMRHTEQFYMVARFFASKGATPDQIMANMRGLPEPVARAAVADQRPMSETQRRAAELYAESMFSPKAKAERADFLQKGKQAREYLDWAIAEHKRVTDNPNSTQEQIRAAYDRMQEARAVDHQYYQMYRNQPVESDAFATERTYRGDGTVRPPPGAMERFANWLKGRPSSGGGDNTGTASIKPHESHEPVPRNATHEQRRAALEADHSTTTAEAFTTKELPKDFEAQRPILRNPDNWTPERRAFHERVLKSAVEDAQRFAREMESSNPNSEPTIYAMRGNTAAGKTRAIKGGGAPELAGAVDATKDVPHRANNPDNFKQEIYRQDADLNLSSSQAHMESSILSEQLHQRTLTDVTRSDGSPGDMLVDKRLAWAEDVASLQADAARTGRRFAMLDVDADLATSLAGVLDRTPGGADPIPPYDAIRSGFEGVRSQRRQVIEQIAADANSSYKLMGTRPDGSKFLIAEIKPLERGQTVPADPMERVIIHDEAAYGRMMPTPEKARLDALTTSQQVITRDVIDELCGPLGEYGTKLRRKLLKHEGKTWQQAVDDWSKAPPEHKPHGH